MDKERQVRYNSVRSFNNPECMQWWFLIIDNKKDMFNTFNGIYDLFDSIEEEGRTYEWKVKGTKLKAKLIEFESRTKIEKSKLNGLCDKVVLDNKLRHYKNPDGLINYLTEQLEK